MCSHLLKHDSTAGYTTCIVLRQLTIGHNLSISNHLAGRNANRTKLPRTSDVRRPHIRHKSHPFIYSEPYPRRVDATADASRRNVGAKPAELMTEARCVRPICSGGRWASDLSTRAASERLGAADHQTRCARRRHEAPAAVAEKHGRSRTRIVGALARGALRRRGRRAHATRTVSPRRMRRYETSSETQCPARR